MSMYGPMRRITAVGDRTPDGTAITYECGHVGRIAPHFDARSLLGTLDACVACGREQGVTFGRSLADGPATDPTPTATPEDDAYERALTYARTLGTEHGTNAAGWYEQDAYGGRVDGYDAVRNAARILSGIAAGDPAVLDTFPSADLSGEWADTLTGPQLVADAVRAAGLDPDALPEHGDGPAIEWSTDICDAYEQAFADAVSAEIERTARLTVEWCDECGAPIGPEDPHRVTEDVESWLESIPPEDDADGNAARTFVLTIELGNAAMSTATDVADALRAVANSIAWRDALPDAEPDGRPGMPIHDGNGNSVGSYGLATDTSAANAADGPFGDPALDGPNGHPTYGRTNE